MPFTTDGAVHETTDASTTSFESGVSSVKTYSVEGASETDGPHTNPGDSSDEVDPRKLLSSPTLNNVRWLYRESFAKKLVDKPVDDAFKNGFEVKDGRDDLQGLLRDTFVPRYKLAQKKARRDGFALLFMVLEDTSDGVHEDPLDEDVSVSRIKKLQPLTLDDLSRFNASQNIPSGRLDNEIPYEQNRYEIRKTGMVVDMDPNSETYKDPLGYLVGVDNPKGADDVRFVHHNRVFHYTWNREVDGDLDSDTLGMWEGDSVLITVYHILQGLKKGNWSIMQTLFRYAAKLYHVALPEDANDEDWEQADENLQNLNAMGELLTPAGYEVEDFQTDGQLDPEPYFEVMFQQVCASLEMTKSVLFGTQSGVVSGSETDIKNYFNQVQRLRQSRVDDDLHEFATRYYRMTEGRTDNEEYEADFDIEWGPLFKLSDLDQAEALTRTMQTLSAAINSFVMTPQEARSVLQEEWAEADIGWSDEFSQEEEEFLRTLNIAQMGAEAALPDEMKEGSTQQQNGGGMQQGQQTAASDPSVDNLDNAPVERIAERVAQKLKT